MLVLKQRAIKRIDFAILVALQLGIKLTHSKWNQFIGKLRESHKGSKKRLKRVSNAKIQLKADSIMRPTKLGSPLPEYALPPHSSDVENLFFQHRWLFLIEGDLSSPEANQKKSSKIEAWIASQPEKGSPIWEAYSCSERIANLVNWISFIPRKQSSSLISESIRDFIDETIQWLLERIEFYGSNTNNHILNNARALILGGMFNGNVEAVNVGARICDQFVDDLIQSEGFCRERSSHYHLLLLSWLCDIERVLSQAGLERLEAFSKISSAKSRATLAAQELTNSKGKLAILIGDISPDQSPDQTTEVLKNFHKIELQTSELRNGAYSLDDWHFIQISDSKVILNWPKSFPPKFPTHEHCDLTSFTWTKDDEPLLVDRGRSRYSKDGSRFKEAWMHSCPTVNGCSPGCESLAQSSNYFPLPYAKTRIRPAVAHEDALTVEHNGFQRATPVEFHSREIALTQNAVRIRDSFRGQGAVEIEFYWQLATEFKPVDTRRFQSSSGSELVIQIFAENSDLAILQLGPDEGVEHCAQYGKEEPAYAWKVSAKTSLPCEIKTVITRKTCAE